MKFQALGSHPFQGKAYYLANDTTVIMEEAGSIIVWDFPQSVPDDGTPLSRLGLGRQTEVVHPEETPIELLIPVVEQYT